MRRVGWIWGLALGGWMGGAAVAVLAVACGKSGPEGGGGAGAGGGSTDGGSDAGPAGLTCSKLLSCDQACTADGCTNNCYAESTGVAQGLFNAFTNCLNANCSSAAGGPCASASSSACSSCQTGAATGACISDLLGCEQDTTVGPADPDGGGVVVPPMDAGAALSCGQYIVCVATCSVDGGTCTSSCSSQATPEARALAGVLNGCLATACPSGDGGACTMQGSACNGCVEQAEFGGTCATPYNACEMDTSNSPDGGGTPTPLQGGTLSTVLTGVNQVGSTMIVQDGYLYFSQEGNISQVSRLSLTDGGTVMPLGPPQPTPVALAVDSNNAYSWNYGTFTGTSNLNNGDGTVVQIPLNGGAPVTIGKNVEVFYSAPYLNAIAVDQSNVYWVEGANGNDGAIMRTAIGSPNAAPIYIGQLFPEALVLDATNVYWATWGTFDAQGNSNNDGTISQGPLGGGTPMILASGLSAPACMAIDANNVYWTNLGKLGGDNLPALNSGSVMQVPIGGGKVTTLASQQSVPVGIAVAKGMVYWTEYGLGAPGLILSVPVGGGTVVPLVAGLRDPYSLALSATTLYFSSYMAAMPTSSTNVLISSLSPY